MQWPTGRNNHLQLQPITTQDSNRVQPICSKIPPSVCLHCQGFDPTPFTSLTLKTFMYHISRGRGRCREKAILAYSKRHTRRLCLSTTEYLSQAGGESKPLCACTTKNVLLFKIETSKNNTGRGHKLGSPDLLRYIRQR